MGTAPEHQQLDEILTAFDENLDRIRLFRDQLIAAINSSADLAPHVHSVRSRIKDREHLRHKLMRKEARCAATGDAFPVTPGNLLTMINDLVGVRILHLYTRQIAPIDVALRNIFVEQQYELLEGPFARTWDDESRAFFQSCGIDTQLSPTMYTSVHYVVGSASRTTVTCEVQVRTLMEEVWGEVDHTINYPAPTDVLASTEQLKVLARVTSSASRLVDSIFLTHADAMQREHDDPGAPAPG
jgi:putative GTP pyrophosphokinase